MSLSPAFLDELRARTMLSALIARTTKLQRAGREFRACCPFHNEKTPSFYVNDEKGFYHCFGCSAHGDAIRWLTDAQGLPFMDAVKELAAAAGLDLPAPDPRAAEREERAAGLHDVMAAAAAWFAEQYGGLAGAGARTYLEGRGITEATRKTFELGFAPDSRGGLKKALAKFGDAMLVEAGLLIDVEGKEPYDRFRDRLMIPIRDPRGRVIAFGGRIIGQGEPKYLNSPETPLFDKGRTLYNLDRAAPAARKAGRVIVVEGYLDVIALAQAGIDEAVAPLGTALTEGQLDRLWRVNEVPVLCFDGDAAGQKAGVRAATRALPMLAPGRSLAFLTLPPGQDPDDLVRSAGASAFEALLAHPEPLVDRLWRHEREAATLRTPEGRAALLENALSQTATIEHGEVKRQYETEFRDRFYSEFGWKKAAVSAVRSAIQATKPTLLKPGADRIIRSILLGLSRHPEVLTASVELVQAIPIANLQLQKWRDVLIEEAIRQPNLDEDLIATILAGSRAAPIEPRNIWKDLRFSFFRPRGEVNEQARVDLLDVINVVVEEHELAHALAAAEARFKANVENEEWELYRTLRSNYRLAFDRFRYWASAAEEALAA